MRLLLDTCVLSELRQPDIHPRLKELMDVMDEKDLFVSVISVGELVKGIFLLEEGRRKRDLLSWVGGLERSFGDRILDVDQEAARIWGEITAKAKKMGSTVPACDGLIASIALRHGLHLLTRNSKDFTPTGAMILNPWQS